MFPLRRPSKPFYVPERCSPSRVHFAAPNYGAPLMAARRSGQLVIATGGSGGNMTQSHGTKNQHLGPQKGLTRRSISVLGRDHSLGLRCNEMLRCSESFVTEVEVLNRATRQRIGPMYSPCRSGAVFPLRGAALFLEDDPITDDPVWR